jgi:hypothetical protein
MSNLNQTSPRPSLAALALIGMSVLELIVSVVLFFAQIYYVAIAFAVASLLLTLMASQIKPMSAAGVQRHRRAAPRVPVAEMPRALRYAFVGSLAIGFALVIGAAILALVGEGLAAVTMALWALALGMQALRFRAGS